MAEKHMAMIYVSEELLREALAMPEGSKIVDIRRQNKWQGVPVFEMLVEHEDLPVVPEGDDLPLVTPAITADYEKRPGTWLRWDWNLPT